jgi:hypothetical protein
VEGSGEIDAFVDIEGGGESLASGCGEGRLARWGQGGFEEGEGAFVVDADTEGDGAHAVGRRG